MASIRKRGNSYLIVVSRGYDYQGNRLKSAQRIFHPPEGLTEKQLEKWLNEQAVLFEREVKQEETPTDESITLYGYYQIWSKEIAPKKFERSSLLRVTSYIERLMPLIGKVKLKSLKAADLQDLYDILRETKSQKHPDRCLQEQTVRGIHHDLSSMLTDAVKKGYLKSNPAFGAYKPKGMKKEVTIADEAMIQKIFTILEQEPLKYELYFKLLITTGMRRSEAAALQWRDIYFEDCSIHIQRSLVNVKGERWYTKCPKTKAGQRVVYISDKMLYLIKLQMQSMQYFMKKTFNKELVGEDFVFMGEDGRQGRIPIRISSAR